MKLPRDVDGVQAARALQRLDATVLSAGGEGRTWDYQGFFPSYLAPRILTNPVKRPFGHVVPSQINFKQEFTVTCNSILQSLIDGR